MNRTKPFVFVIAVLVTIGLLAACNPGSPVDPYADPGTEPPPPVEDPTITTSGSVSESSKGGDLLDINVAGFAAPGEDAVPDLTESDFTVVEDGTVKGITVERIGGSTRAAADIVFVFDTTGSMGSGLNSVQDSIISFSEYLDDAGLDVRLGAVTYGDAFDTVADVDSPARGESLRRDTPPSFDTSVRPSFDLSTDFAAFQSFIADDSPRGGGDGPENGTGAVNAAYDELSWRSGAQRIMIVITDICSHTDATFESTFGTAASHWQPPATEDLIDKLQGNATVHVVGPESHFCGEEYPNMNVLTGASGTGGAFYAWDGSSEFDLSTLPIAEAASGGYIVTFRGTRDGEEHEVRVVIDDSGSIRGEFTINPTY